MNTLKYCHLFIYFLLRSNFNLVARSIRYSHRRHVLIFDFEAVFSTEFADICVIYLYTKFYIPNSSGLLINALKPKAKCRIQGASNMLAYILQEWNCFNTIAYYQRPVNVRNFRALY
jgi:hypothetical protein